jgi:hypothetical protein
MPALYTGLAANLDTRRIAAAAVAAAASTNAQEAMFGSLPCC